MKASKYTLPVKVLKSKQTLHEIFNPLGIVGRGYFSNAIPYLCYYFFKQYIKVRINMRKTEHDTTFKTS